MRTPLRLTVAFVSGLCQVTTRRQMWVVRALANNANYDELSEYGADVDRDTADEVGGGRL